MCVVGYADRSRSRRRRSKFCFACAEDGPDQGIQCLEFIAELKLRGDATCRITQAVELGLAVDPRDLIHVFLDLLPGPALGRAASRACRLQVLKQCARSRGEMQAFHEQVVPLNRTLALEQPDRDPG